MKPIPLSDFVAKVGQTQAAKELGMTQGAMCKALQSGREIYVEKRKGGLFAYEVKPFPSTAKHPVDKE